MSNAKEKFQLEPISDRYYYPHVERQQRVRLVTECYEYEAPFKYDNIRVTRYNMRNREAHGVELSMVNVHVDENGDAHDFGGDSIVIEDEAPMVRVAVVGSACTPPGFVQIECEPVPEWRNAEEEPEALPVRFRQTDLWGMHLRVDALRTTTADVAPMFDRADESSPYGEMPAANAALYPSLKERQQYHKHHYRENPLAGMSCAVFEIPPSRRVTIQAGSQIPAWGSDNFPGDHHYSVRLIRTHIVNQREA